MVEKNHLKQNERDNICVNKLIQPPREKGVKIFRENKLSVYRVQQPKNPADIERQRKSERCKDVVSNSSDQRLISKSWFIRSNEIIQECNREVNTLNNLNERELSFLSSTTLSYR